MGVSKRFSKEERDLDKFDTLEMLKQGVTHAEVARELGRSTQYIVNLKNELVAEGLITPEEIREARKKAIDAKRELKRNKSKTVAEEKEKSRDERKKRVLEKIKLRMTVTEISKELHIPRTTLNRYIKELVSEGEINEKDVISQEDKNREKGQGKKDVPSGELESSNQVIPNQDATLSENEKQVLEYLLQGQNYPVISKKMELRQSEIVDIKNILIGKKAITSKAIKNARENKQRKDEEDVIKLLKRGYTQAEIKHQKKDTINLSRMITKLKSEGRITDEEIREAQERAQRDEKDEIAKLVLRGMKRGLTVKEIIDSDEHGYLTERRVRDMQQELIMSGRITKKEFGKKKSMHKTTSRKAKESELNKRIWDAFNQEKTTSQIATDLNLSESYVSTKINQIFRQKRLSKKEIRCIKYGNVLRLLRKGITTEEIANCLGISIATARKRQKEFLEDGTITQEQLKEYKNRRKQEFSEARRKAREEYEDDSAKSASRKRFFELAQAEISYGNTLDKDDVQMLGRCIINNNIFLTKENLKLVCTQYGVKCNLQETKQFFEKLMLLYFDTKFGDSIKEFRDCTIETIRKQNRQSQESVEVR